MVALLLTKLDAIVGGLVPLTFRSLNSFMRPFVQMPRGFYHLATSACALDYKTR